MKRIISLITLIALVLFFRPSVLNAAPPAPPPNPGSYTCRFIGIGPVGECVLDNSSCASGAMVPNPNACTSRSSTNCASPPNPSCVFNPNTCAGQGGTFTNVDIPCLFGTAPNCSDCAFGFKCCLNSTGGGGGGGGVTSGPPIVSCSGSKGFQTAIGCIPLEKSEKLTEFLLNWGIGLGGGVALILIVYAGFMIITAAGNPQRLQAGKELLTAAISGVLLLVFSVYILRVLGIDILGIPGIT